MTRLTQTSYIVYCSRTACEIRMLLYNFKNTIFFHKTTACTVFMDIILACRMV